MFIRDLSEQLMVQTKTIKQSDFGPDEKWTNRGKAWASVSALSARETAYAGQGNKNDKDEVSLLYKVRFRNLDRNFTYGEVRFLWLPSDGNPDNPATRVLVPATGSVAPGKQSKRWTHIICKDVTGYTVNKSGPT